MAVDTTEVSRVFNSYMVDISNSLDALYSDDKIDATTYAKIVSSATQNTLQLATSTVQQQPSLDVQVLKSEADTDFVKQQDKQLAASVEDNRNIKAMDTYGTLLGTMGAGGITVGSAQWTLFFDMLNKVFTGTEFTNPGKSDAIKVK